MADGLAGNQEDDGAGRGVALRVNIAGTPHASGGVQGQYNRRRGQRKHFGGRAIAAAPAGLFPAVGIGYAGGCEMPSQEL